MRDAQKSAHDPSIGHGLCQVWRGRARAGAQVIHVREHLPEQSQQLLLPGRIPLGYMFSHWQKGFRCNCPHLIVRVLETMHYAFQLSGSGMRGK